MESGGLESHTATESKATHTAHEEKNNSPSALNWPLAETTCHSYSTTLVLHPVARIHVSLNHVDDAITLICGPAGET
jgi:hypothetical protein